MIRLDCLATILFSAALPLVWIAGAAAQPAHTLDVGDHDTAHISHASLGIWFEAPVDFEITRLRVPDEAGLDEQQFEVVRFEVAAGELVPGMATSSFVSLGRWSNVPASAGRDVTVAVRAGDVVGIFGARTAARTNQQSHSLGSSPAVDSKILGAPVTLRRASAPQPLHQGPLSVISSQTGTVPRLEITVAPLRSLSAQFVPRDQRQFVGPLSPGLAGQGVVLATLELHTGREALRVNEIEVMAIGSAPADMVFEDVAWHDDDGNGLFDGAPIDPLAVAHPGSFVNDRYVATIREPTIAVDASRRLYLVARLTGVAQPGESFDFSLARIAVTRTNGADAKAAGVPSIKPALGVSIDDGAIEVRRGPGSLEPDASLPGGNPFDADLLSLSIANSSDKTAAVAALRVRTKGSGSFSAHTTRVAVMRLDDPADPHGSATELGTAMGRDGEMELVLVAPLMLAAGEAATLTVRVTFSPLASGPGDEVGSSRTYEVHLVSPNDVVGSLAARFGEPAPTHGSLRVVDFRLMTFTPLFASNRGHDPIVIMGRGFSYPIEVRIGGIVCPGEPKISDDGMLITGLRIPRCSLVGEQSIEVDVGTLPTQTFGVTLQLTGTIGQGSRCAAVAASADQPVPWPMLLVLVSLVLWATRRRCRVASIRVQTAADPSDTIHGWTWRRGLL